MKNPKSLAYQRKRPRYQKKVHIGVPKSPGTGTMHDTDREGAAAGDGDAPETMEARTLEAEAAYEFAGQDTEDKTNSNTGGPGDSPDSAPPAAESGEGGPRPPSSPDPQAHRREQENQRREAERMRRDQERERREAERKERERRDAERRDQLRKEQERRERERMQELRSLDVESICEKAWDIYSAEVKEEGVELFPDNDARELAKRSFRLAEVFLLEEGRLRKLRNDPLQPASDSSGSGEASDGSPETGGEPTMGE